MTSTTSHWLQQFQSTSLPTLPHITEEFIQLCRQSDTSLDKLFHLASQDPALSFRLFAKASSICRERETVIRQVDHAISALGLGFLQGQSQELTPLKINAKISFIDQEYCRSLEQALLAGQLARQACYELHLTNGDEFFIAAMLFSSARWWLWRCAPEKMVQLAQQQLKEQHPAAKVEKAIFGSSLQQLSLALLQQHAVQGLPLNCLQHITDIDARKRQALIDAVLDPSILLQAEMRFSGDQAYALVIQSCAEIAYWLDFAPYQQACTDAIAVLAGQTHTSLARTQAWIRQAQLAAAQPTLDCKKPPLLPRGQNLLLLAQPAWLKARQLGYPEQKAKAPTATNAATPKQAGTKPTANKKPLHFSQFLAALNHPSKPPKTLGQALQLAARALHEGLSYQRVLIAMLDKTKQHLQVKLTLGVDKSDPLAKYQCKLTNKDLFSKLLTKPQYLWVNAINRGQFVHMIPGSFKASTLANGMLYGSICINKRPVALLYADQGPEGAEFDEKDYQNFKKLGKSLNLCLQKMSNGT